MIDAWRTHQISYLVLLAMVSVSGMLWTPSLQTQMVLLAVGVALVGIMHGAIDYRFGKELITSKLTRHWHIPFGLLYLGFAGLMLALWIVHSLLALIVFFLLAIPHFGYVDVHTDGYTAPAYHVAAVTTGTLPILLPVLVSPGQVSTIFHHLMISGPVSLPPEFIQTIAAYALLLVVPAYALALLLRGFSSDLQPTLLVIDLLETAFLTIAFWLCQPLIAFGVYYCFGHSLREGLDISHELNPHNLLDGSMQFVRSSLPLTAVTIVGGLAVWIWMQSQGIGVRRGVPIIVFLGLSSLLVPHMIVEYAFAYVDDVRV